MRLFILDPRGVDVLGGPNRPLTIFYPGSPFAGLESSVIGASRRSLREIFGATWWSIGRWCDSLGTATWRPTEWSS